MVKVLIVAFIGLVFVSGCKSDYADFTGDWRTDWGSVSFTESKGTYSDTYGTGPGTIELTKTGDNTFSATWGESPKRHGTMSLTLSGDGKMLTGTWTPAPDVQIGGKQGGTIRWTKK